MNECPRCSIVVDLQTKIDRLKLESLSGLELAQIKMTIDGLKKENEELRKQFAYDQYMECQRLQNLHDATMVLQGKIIAKNEKLKEALKECNPLNIIAYADIEAECQFCKGKVVEVGKFGQWELNLKHSDDCDYMKLCGKGGDDGET